MCCDRSEILGEVERQMDWEAKTMGSQRTCPKLGIFLGSDHICEVSKDWLLPPNSLLSNHTLEKSREKLGQAIVLVCSCCQTCDIVRTEINCFACCLVPKEMCYIPLVPSRVRHVPHGEKQTVALGTIAGCHSSWPFTNWENVQNAMLQCQGPLLVECHCRGRKTSVPG